LAGFEVLEIGPVDHGESLRALVSWSAPDEGPQVQAGVGQLQTQFERFVRECRARGQRVAVWGAGGKGLSILATVDLTEVDVVVDADPTKAGRWTPVSHREVFPPSELAHRHVDTIIVTAPAYQFEIARHLRRELKFTGLIALAGTRFQMFEEAIEP
jgi:D-arabinose 1-dehydrogenase-like Zn-dependent alcohol dehydrogenase